MEFQQKSKFLLGDDLLRLLSICLLFTGTLVLSVGISGVCGTVHHSKGWMTMVSPITTLIFNIMEYSNGEKLVKVQKFNEQTSDGLSKTGASDMISS